ncbi:MAG: Ktr system potassium transporter B [Gammaproteobacteria bacterium HGW-Gammaproteobacteria-3]|nr:MAG: Ktr system potassium transporter B [Gammaproteobacteria bacterium HGW-Gammaproteobacteria-3]
MIGLTRLSRHIKKSQLQLTHAVFNISPPVILTCGYLGLVVVGTLLLKLEVATYKTISWLDALFTATSALTVTGLAVLDTGSDFTVFGQMTIALLIQAGGLGFMTFALLTAMSLGKRIGVKHQLLALEALNQTSLSKIWEVAAAVFYFAITIEAVGFVLLTLLWSEEQGFERAAYEAFFYTLSAFNNAGFGLSANSLSRYAGDIPVNLVISALFIIGGLGFVVLSDLWQVRGWKKLQLYSKVMISATIIVNLIAWLLVWLFERQNPATLGHFSLPAQLTAAWFHAVTPRTAGFNTLPIESLTDSTTLLTLLLMFIGGGSLSTTSGIKLSTAIVIFTSTYAFLRRRDEVTLMRRSVPQNIVMKAFVISVISLGMVFAGTLLLSAMEHAPLIDVLFEVVSALGTVGLSRGLTGELSDAGRWLVMLLMFAGRLGPLTFVYVIATPKQRRIKYPGMDIPVG